METRKPNLNHVNIKNWWHSIYSKRPTIFHSARLKLTGFYLAVLLILCLTLTISVRALADREYIHIGLRERNFVRKLLFNQFSVPPEPYSTFNHYQSDQDDAARHHLNEDLILINATVLVLGGWLSYWYAGRTLRPIEEAHEAQARFAADASHELRTPLANIKVENEIFLRQKSANLDEAKQLITSNLEEVQRLENLASNLLTLTSYDRGDIELETVEIKQIIEETISSMDKAISNKQAQLNIKVHNDKVLGNKASLVQLMSIILDNALKYGSKKGDIYIDGYNQSRSYILTVRDEGVGIDPGDLPYIFDRLYRGDKARNSKVGGYGLGLSLAKSIVQANRGSIQAANYPSGGAILTVTLKTA